MIDFDFQASLGSMSIAEKSDWLPPDGQDSRATHLISGDLTQNEVAGESKHATGANNLKIITSYYDLAQAENRLMIEWLLGDRKTDIRFRLAELLHSNAVRNAFSLIIIDCPPRLTTSAIQALAAGTHLLIPTRLEEPSTEAVITFVQQVETFRKAGLCPHIKHIGVVATIVDPRTNTEGVKTRLKDALKDSLDTYGGGGVTELLDCEIPQSAKFRETSGKGITYLMMGNGADTQNLRTGVHALADVVKKEMKL
jgi:chromosome partitioning protein